MEAALAVLDADHQHVHPQAYRSRSEEAKPLEHPRPAPQPRCLLPQLARPGRPVVLGWFRQLGLHPAMRLRGALGGLTGAEPATTITTPSEKPDGGEKGALTSARGFRLL